MISICLQILQFMHWPCLYIINIFKTNVYITVVSKMLCQSTHMQLDNGGQWSYYLLSFWMVSNWLFNPDISAVLTLDYKEHCSTQLPVLNNTPYGNCFYIKATRSFVFIPHNNCLSQLFYLKNIHCFMRVLNILLKFFFTFQKDINSCSFCLLFHEGSQHPFPTMNIKKEKLNSCFLLIDVLCFIF